MTGGQDNPAFKKNFKFLVKKVVANGRVGLLQEMTSLRLRIGMDLAVT